MLQFGVVGNPCDGHRTISTLTSQWRALCGMQRMGRVLRLLPDYCTFLAEGQKRKINSACSEREAKNTATLPGTLQQGLLPTTGTCTARNGIQCLLRLSTNEGFVELFNGTGREITQPHCETKH